MKILSIRIKNLASLAGEHFIDFESEPLANAGLIAIIGKTGAGKSTILDAMCLALFNQVPRLKGSDGKLVDVDGSELLTNSPLTVLRRGTGHGFAELVFVAQDQKHYLARWEIKRARESATGKLQSVQRHLKCLTDGVVIADKAKAVDASIHKITQLSFEQFTRAVLLAQSEVTAFLKARDNERGALLEYLTNSNIFAKIGEIAFRKTADIEKERKKLEEMLGHIEIISEQDLTDLQQQHLQIKQQLTQLEQEKTRLELQQQWFEHKHKLEQEIALKQQHFDTQQLSHQQLSQEREQLQRLEVFSSIRPVVFQQQHSIQAQQQLAPKILQSEQQFLLLENQFEAEKKIYLAAETALKNTQEFEQQHDHALQQVRHCIQEREFIAQEFRKANAKLDELKLQKQPLEQQLNASLQHAQQLEHNQATITQQLQHSQQFSALDHGLDVHLGQLQRFIQHYQHIENSLGNLATAQQHFAQQQQQLEQHISQFGNVAALEQQLAAIRQQREQKLAQQNKFSLIEQRLTQWFSDNHEKTTAQSQLDTLTITLQQLQKQTQQTEQDYQTAKLEREKLQQFLQQQRLLHTESIEQLRDNLQSGEACLVCGSTHHPYKEDQSIISKTLFNLQQQQEQHAIELEQTTFKIWQDQQLHLTQLQTEHTQTETTILQLTTKLEATKDALEQLFKIAALQLNLEQPQQGLNEEFSAAQTQLKLSLEQAEQQIANLIQASQDQQLLSKQIQEQHHLLESAQTLQTQVNDVFSCLSPAQQQAWQQNTVQTAQQIQQDLQQRFKHLQQLQQLNTELNVQQQGLQKAQSDLGYLLKQLEETQQVVNEFSEKGQQNSKIACSLIFDMTGTQQDKPNDWLKAHDQKRQQQQTTYTELKQQFEQLRQNFETQKNQLNQLKVQQQQHMDAKEKSDTEIQQWLTLHPDFAADQLTQLLLIDNTQEQQIRQQIQQAERMLNEASSALKTMHGQLAEHLKLQPDCDFTVLQQRLEQHLTVLKTQRDAYDQLNLKLEVHQQNVLKLQKFADQIQSIQQQEHRWGKISGLIGDAKGKDFRDYAQQYNLDILVEHANQQLAMLSQRYTLKRLDHSLSLAIVDHDMDGETRSVSSLSGGESFLTALALSLAIANMASGSMKIESLFIDEGFGTLDASSLYMVMNALDQLQSQGRKVVLISHIQEMHERIPVQIQVKPLGAGASTIQVVG
ncbi:AAA family ATPase [Acinetobacter terrae]|jgi:exonuclease SbcC|uniref:AAA family ATPase n=1 Tax=Acinetobacter terrae TaxID=2731247 RepID=UPI0007D8654B|nr:AAA family ATPase [Acinetobacter terrae]NNH16746.1 AAA family ATPase [Acinetobacter terrae]OAL85229.1 ATP-dependent dsDNA exonuclease [Acinetobacter terrae]